MLTCSCRFDLGVHGLDLPTAEEAQGHCPWSPGTACASLGWGWATPEAAATWNPCHPLGRALPGTVGRAGAAGAAGWEKSSSPPVSRAGTEAGTREGAAPPLSTRSSPGSREAAPILRSSQGCPGQGTARGPQSRTKLPVIMAGQAKPGLPSWMKALLGSCRSLPLLGKLSLTELKKQAGLRK